MVGFARVNEYFDVIEKNGIANQIPDLMLRKLAMEKPPTYQIDGVEIKVEYIADDRYGLLIIFRPNMNQLTYMQDGRE